MANEFPEATARPIEQQAFDGFSFALGQIVRHKASKAVGVVTNRVLIQAQTGNTGRTYYVGTGEHIFRSFEIELEDAALHPQPGETK